MNEAEIDRRNEATIARLEAARVDPPELREEEEELCDGCPRNWRCCINEGSWDEELTARRLI